MACAPNPARRVFLKQAAACGAGLAAASCLLRSTPRAQAAPAAPSAPPLDPSMIREADRRYWQPRAEKKVACALCPNKCELKDGETGICRTRKNSDGVLMTHSYNDPLIVTLDPIEKIPLYHFAPGSRVLTLATAGCNLRCLYCQNFTQSQARPEDLPRFNVPKEDAVAGALDKKAAAIAYTYTDPLAFYEYSRDVAAHAKEKGLPTVLGTAGYIQTEPLKEWCKVVDAFTITLKGFDAKYYEKVIGGKLKNIQETLTTIKAANRWIEVACLIVPTYNDDIDKIRQMAKWMKENLGADVPLHFERFDPNFRLRDLPRTPVLTLEHCRDAALAEGLHHVYLCNVSPHAANNTYCPKCNNELIKRLGFTTLENKIANNACPKCNTVIAGLWTRPAVAPEPAAIKAG